VDPSLAGQAHKRPQEAASAQVYIRVNPESTQEFPRSCFHSDFGLNSRIGTKATSGTRTLDPVFTKDVLYQLS
jgi:hypothetical protein